MVSCLHRGASELRYRNAFVTVKRTLRRQQIRTIKMLLRRYKEL